jgi:hypothetical protein
MSRGQTAVVKTVFASTLFLLLPTVVHAASVSVCPAETQLDCQINDLTIDGTTYDVTFGNTIDLTFPGYGPNAILAIGEINAALNVDNEVGIGDGDPAQDGAFGPLFLEVAIGVGVSALDYGDGGYAGNVWTPNGYGAQVDYPTEADGGNALFAEFTEVSSAAPEPTTLATMFGAVALMALASRKRRTQHEGQAKQPR